MIITKEVRDFINYYTDTVLSARQAHISEQLHNLKDPTRRTHLYGALTEVVETSLDLRRIASINIESPNNDHEDDGC